MSKENLEQFMNQIAESEELQAKIGEEIDAEALIALGAECGCEFTAEELQDSAELSDEELDGVAGGAIKAGGRAGMVSWVLRKGKLLDTATVPRLEPGSSAPGSGGFKINFDDTDAGLDEISEAAVRRVR